MKHPTSNKARRARRDEAATRPIIQPRLVRRTAAASYLSVSPSVLDSYRHKGLIRSVALPAVRGAGELRTPVFDIQDLDRFVDTLKRNEGGVNGE